MVILFIPPQPFILIVSEIIKSQKGLIVLKQTAILNLKKLVYLSLCHQSAACIVDFLYFMKNIVIDK